MKFDRDGILLADVPGSGVARADPNARSGNPLHDTRSGKFGGGGGRKRPTVPPNVTRAAFARYRDAVREAARRFKGNIGDEALMAFINQRANNPNAVNLKAFAALAQQQQLDDLVDVLDGRAHGGIKLTVPRGYVKRVLAGLSEDDVGEIMDRLEARGIKDPHLVMGKALPAERRKALEVKRAERGPVQASDRFDWHSDEDQPEHEPRPDFDAVELAEILAQVLPTPQVTVQPPEVRVEPTIVVELPPTPATRKVVERDEKGLIWRVTEELAE